MSRITITDDKDDQLIVQKTPKGKLEFFADGGVELDIFDLSRLQQFISQHSMKEAD